MMDRNESLDYLGLLGREIKCSCGRTHSIPVEYVLIEEGANNRLIEILDLLGYHDGYHLVEDANTHEAAGRSVESLLEASGRRFGRTFFESRRLLADMNAVKRVEAEIGTDVSCVIAIGSGTLNDVTRYASFRRGKPYIIVATAPSMDGYTSTVSPIMTDGFKQTLQGQPPMAVIGDLDTLCSAPDGMITSGFGDIAGKFTSLCDWKLSRLVCGEYYCEYVVSLIEQTLDKLMQNVEGIGARERGAIENLMHCLIISGIGMLMVGNSRPASGCEHHLAHFWEMKFLMEGRDHASHGHNVGVSGYYMTALYRWFRSLGKRSAAGADIGGSDTNSRIERVYGPLSKEVIAENNKYRKPVDRTDLILGHWEEIEALADSLPEPSAYRAMLISAGAPAGPGDIGVDKELLVEGLENCMYIRERYTMLRLLDDMGLLKTAVGAIKSI